MIKIINKLFFVSALFLGMFLAANVAYASSTGVVNLSSGTLNVRSGESTNSPKIGSIANGATVTIVSIDGDWEHIQCGSIDGYVSSQYISTSTSASTSSSGGNARWTSGVVSSLNVRSGPGTNYSVVASLQPSTQVTLISKQGDWAQIGIPSGGTGWVLATYLDVGVPTTNLSSRSGGGSVDGARLAAYASSSTFLGIPYVYGGASLKGFDCSGFTMYVYNHFGISLPHNAAAQYGYGVSVAKSDLQAGDLVFFTSSGGGKSIGHVGIYIGNGQFVDAHTYGQPLGISSLSAPGYVNRYVGARRILN